MHPLKLRRSSSQSGLTLIEMMISMGLGLLLVLASTSLLISSKSTYIAQTESVGIQETGRYAVEIIMRALHQAAYEDWDRQDASMPAVGGPSISLVGMDSHSLKSNTSGIDAPVKKAINGSDILGVRFNGAGSGEQGDGTILNCAGFGIAASASRADESHRGWSIFYVAADSTGEPELRCKYKGKNSWSAVAIARGVESFQVLYGLDTDENGVANRYVTATQLRALDESLILTGIDAAEKALDQMRKTHWNKVVSVKVAVLIRSQYGSREGGSTKQYDLFGEGYSDINAKLDPGVRVQEKSMPLSIRNKIRKIFAVTIQLRNQPAGSAA